ncbi:FaeA/PapI family transcriptional regulator [Muricomes intestini]|uniref:FaeA/PapI family transcriptional regulator n=1 Tax=Muricomes intestini TaxID=1796634 RepID=UPI003A5C7D5F
MYLQENGEAKTSDIADFIGLSAERIRVLLAEMSDVERIGRNRDRIYRLKKDS